MTVANVQLQRLHFFQLKKKLKFVGFHINNISENFWKKTEKTENGKWKNGLELRKMENGVPENHKPN